VAHIGEIWSAVTMLSYLMTQIPDAANEAMETAERAIPDIRYYLDNLAGDPIYNYMPFDCPEGTLPNGDTKSSPLKFHLDRSKQRIVVTGNRCAKTYSSAAEVIAGCIGMNPVTKRASERFTPPVNVWTVSDTEDTSIEIVQAKYRELCPEYLLTDDCDFTVQRGWKNNVIVFKPPFNSVIRFRYSSQGASSFQGTKQEIIHLDEEQPKDVDDECVARTAGVGGAPGEIIRSFTPIYRESVGISWIHPSLYTRRAEIPDLRFHFWTLFDVPDWIISLEEKNRIVASYDEDSRDTRTYGLFQPSGIRLAFPMDLIKEQREVHMRDPVMGWLDEEEYEVEAVPEDAYFSRAAAQVEFETRQRIVFKAVV
jgi:hypothetical protein